MSKVYDVVAGVGRYQDRNGNEKTRWVRCGAIFRNAESGRLSLKLESVPVGNEWEGWFSLMEPRDEHGNPGSKQTRGGAGAQAGASNKSGQQAKAKEFEDDDIPF